MRVAIVHEGEGGALLGVALVRTGRLGELDLAQLAALTRAVDDQGDRPVPAIDVREPATIADLHRHYDTTGARP